MSSAGDRAICHQFNESQQNPYYTPKMKIIPYVGSNKYDSLYVGIIGIPRPQVDTV